MSSHVFYVCGRSPFFPLGISFDSDIPQLTRPPNAVSAALWLRGQTSYRLTNPSNAELCVRSLNLDLYYLDGSESSGSTTTTMTKVTAASTVDIAYPRGGEAADSTWLCFDGDCDSSCRSSESACQLSVRRSLLTYACC